MERWSAVISVLSVSVALCAQSKSPLPAPGGILQSITNAATTEKDGGLLITRNEHNAPVVLTFTRAQGLGIKRERDQWWVLPLGTAGGTVRANKSLWILPVDAASSDGSWWIDLPEGDLSASQDASQLKVLVNADKVMIRSSEARPHSDPFNHRFSFEFEGGKKLEDALAGFYWGTMLPSVVEKTMAANFPYSDGYVLSTLKVSAYAGSYPAVDHEFQIKGRLAMGSEADLDIVRRMIELQFKLMNDDPERLSRAPTSVQPDGRREYHIRRNSKDNKQNAAMFPLTANIEVLEEAWHYYEASKDVAWLASHRVNLEASAAWTLASIDQYSRLWSDVYYEDQVIKDGRETQAQAFAAYTFGLLAKMETVLHRQDRAVYYTGISTNLAKALIEPLPLGYWDEKGQRFIDWVDRDGKVHDHLHLLANTLPLTFGYATPSQTSSVKQLIARNSAEFERFPSFLSAHIADYDNSEIGDGGPYDLSAAGRYWYWDAAFRESQNQNKMLLDQLNAVASEGASDNYFMGERYDMDHVYYIDGKHAHGAEQYYEYPNVFAAVLISEFLGLTVPVDADVSVAPHLTGYGAVRFEIPEYGLHYSYGAEGFTLKNLSGKARKFKVDLSALGNGSVHYRLSGNSNPPEAGAVSFVTLSPQGEAHWTPMP